MGDVLSRLTSEQNEKFHRSITDLAGLCREFDKIILAEGIEDIPKSESPKIFSEKYRKAWRGNDDGVSRDVVAKFVDEFNTQQQTTEDLLRKNETRWTTDPGSFWGWPRKSSGSATETIKRIYSLNDSVDKTDLVLPMRRRLARIALVDLRNRIQDRMESRKMAMPRPSIQMKAMANHIVFMAISDNGTLSTQGSTFSTRIRDGEQLIKLPEGAILICGKLSSEYLEQVQDKSIARIVDYLAKQHSQSLNETFRWVQATLRQDLLSDFTCEKLDALINSAFTNYSGLLHIVRKRKKPSRQNQAEDNTEPEIHRCKKGRKIDNSISRITQASSLERESQSVAPLTGPQTGKDRMDILLAAASEGGQNMQEPLQDRSTNGLLVESMQISGQPVFQHSEKLCPGVSTIGQLNLFPDDTQWDALHIGGNQPHLFPDDAQWDALNIRDQSRLFPDDAQWDALNIGVDQSHLFPDNAQRDVQNVNVDQEEQRIGELLREFNQESWVLSQNDMLQPAPLMA